eukprot:12910825-Prorocentrum_lima.AAC.1
MDIGRHSWLTGFKNRLDDDEIKKSISSSTWLLITAHSHLNEELAVPCLVLPNTQFTSGLKLGARDHQLEMKLITT